MNEVTIDGTVYVPKDDEWSVWRIVIAHHALEKWKLRTATAGLIARPDLYA